MIEEIGVGGRELFSPVASNFPNKVMKPFDKPFPGPSHGYWNRPVDIKPPSDSSDSHLIRVPAPTSKSDLERKTTEGDRE